MSMEKLKECVCIACWIGSIIAIMFTCYFQGKTAAYQEMSARMLSR